MTRLLIGGLLLLVSLSIPVATAAADDRGDERVRALVASLDKRISAIDEGEIALPALLASLTAQASPPGADKDPKKRISIVVSCGFPEQPVALTELKRKPVHLSAKLVEARLDSVLDRICSQFDGVTLVRADFIEIVPRSSALAEFGLLIPYREIEEKFMPRINPNGFNPDRYQPVMPLLVNRFLTDVPLEKALQQIAERYNQNIILAPQANSKGDTLITARLVNAPIDAAVETLANMADLRMVQKSNVFLVTTREHAAALNAERKQQLKAEKARADKENLRDQ
jgi:hypothetical protein